MQLTTPYGTSHQHIFVSDITRSVFESQMTVIHWLKLLTVCVLLLYKVKGVSNDRETTTHSLFAVKDIFRRMVTTLPDQSVCALSQTCRRIGKQSNLTRGERKLDKLCAERDIQCAVRALFANLSVNELERVWLRTVSGEETFVAELTAQLLQGFDGCVDLIIWKVSENRGYPPLQGLILKNLLVCYHNKYSFVLYPVSQNSQDLEQMRQFVALYVKAKRLLRQLDELELGGDLSKLKSDFMSWILLIEELGAKMEYPALGTLPLRWDIFWLMGEDLDSSVRLLEEDYGSDDRLQNWISGVHELKRSIQQHDWWNFTTLCEEFGPESFYFHN